MRNGPHVRAVSQGSSVMRTALVNGRILADAQIVAEKAMDRQRFVLA
jgi:hypothetical protein